MRNSLKELRIEYECWSLVRDHFNSAIKADKWFMTKNPLLGNIRPYDMLIMGRASKLLKFIQNELEGNYA